MRSGVDTLGLSVSVGPISIIAGFTVAYFKKYRIQCYVCWCMYLIGCGLMSMIHADTPLGPTIVYSIIVTGGGGALYAITDFPVLAPLPVTENGRAITFYVFVRTFATVSPVLDVHGAWMADLHFPVLGNHSGRHGRSERTSETSPTELGSQRRFVRVRRCSSDQGDGRTVEVGTASSVCGQHFRAVADDDWDCWDRVLGVFPHEGGSYEIGSGRELGDRFRRVRKILTFCPYIRVPFIVSILE